MEKLKTLILTKTELWVKLALILLFLMFFLLCIVFTGTLGAQTTVTIGTGTNSQAQPFNALYGYGRSASLYTSAQVTTFGTITNLGWYVATSQATSIPVKIYIKQTSAANLTADTWANMLSGATLVYDANVSFTTTGWFTIDISDFNYSADNLLVLCEANYGGTGTSSYPSFRYSNTTTKQMSFSQDNTPPSGSGTVGNSRPNIQVTIVTCPVLGGTASPVGSPINVGQSTVINCSGYTSTNTNLQWEQSSDGVSSWTNVTGGSGSNTNSYTTPALTETTYYRQKVTDNSNSTCFKYSSIAMVTVVCGLNGGIANADDSDIYMGESSIIICSGYTSSGTTIQWEQSADGSTGWANVVGGSGETTDTYATAALANTTYFRLAVNDGICTSYSNAVVVNTTCGVTNGGTATPVSSPILMGQTTVINCTGY